MKRILIFCDSWCTCVVVCNLYYPSRTYTGRTEKMSEELRECPFCQRRAEHYCYNRRHTVRCRYCFADCGDHDTPEIAASVWNARPTEDFLKTEVENLKKKLENVKQHLIIHRDHSIQSCLRDIKAYQAMNEFMSRFCNGLLELINTDTDKR